MHIAITGVYEMSTVPPLASENDSIVTPLFCAQDAVVSRNLGAIRMPWHAVPAKDATNDG